MKLRLCVDSEGRRSARLRRQRRRLWALVKKSRSRGGHREFSSLSGRRGRIVYIRIRTPKTISCDREAERNELVSFLSTLRASVFSNKTSGVVIDFTSTDTVHPGGMILLIAEIDRILRIIRDPIRIRHKPPRSTKIRHVLQQVGLARLLGDERQEEICDDTVKFWCYATGLLADGKTGGEVLERYEGRLAEGITKGLYNGIVETMTNTIHHAYLEAREDGCPLFKESRWWMLSQEREGKLTVVLCDLGIGIPRSLPKSALFNVERFNELLALLNRKRDLASIRAAVEFGRSRTGLQNRGRGLPQILDSVQAADVGYVRISSNRGIYQIQAGSKDPFEIEATKSISGTLIQWQVQIAGELKPKGVG